jgi:transposase
VEIDRHRRPEGLSGAHQRAIRKGHRYTTILTDVENACVIDLVEERTMEAALQLLGQLPEGSTGSIQAVAMDIWPAYIGAVEQALPEAAIVFDKLPSLRSTLRAASG